MTKKNIILILVIVCFLTVMAISIWGKQPEVSTTVNVSELVIYNQENELVTDTTKDGKTLKIEVDVGDEYNAEAPQTYTFTVAVLPENATSTDITYEIRTSDYEKYASIEKLESTSNKHTFVVTFTEDYFDGEHNINIDFASTGSGATRYAYLSLASTITDGDIIDIF